MKYLNDVVLAIGCFPVCVCVRVVELLEQGVIKYLIDVVLAMGCLSVCVKVVELMRCWPCDGFLCV